MRKLSLGAVLLFAVALGCASKEETSIKIYVQQKLYDKAIAQGAQALVKSPNNGDTHYFMGAAYYGKDGDLKQEAEGYADSSEAFLRAAFTHFSKAKELAPGAWAKSVDDNIVSMFGRHFNRGVIASFFATDCTEGSPPRSSRATASRTRCCVSPWASRFSRRRRSAWASRLSRMRSLRKTSGAFQVARSTLKPPTAAPMVGWQPKNARARSTSGPGSCFDRNRAS